jgi:hypothetical protein
MSVEEILVEHGIVVSERLREPREAGGGDFLQRRLVPCTKELKDTNPLMSSLLVICLGWCSNFAGSESGQKQSVKILQKMFYSTIQHPPQSHTHILYSIVHLL